MQGDSAFSYDPPALLAHSDGGVLLRVVPLTRKEAFTQLRGVVRFLKQTDPHSLGTDAD